MRLLLLFFSSILFTSILLAKDVYPVFTLTAKGHVLDFVYDEAKLYVATDQGTVEIFDLYKQKRISEIKLPQHQTIKESVVPPKIISIDRFNNKTLFVTSTSNAYREVWMHDGKILKKIVEDKQKLTIKNAKFIDDNNYLLGTISHEITLYNNQDRYKAYTKHVEQSTFTHMQLSEDKKHVLTASESGRVSLSEVNTGKLLKTFEEHNVDNINQIAYANNTLITGGQDRRVGVYTPNKSYYIQNDFIVYAIGINPSATLGIYSSSEQNHLQLFNPHNGEKTHQLIGHYAVPSTIKFINDKELFSAGYENTIFYWNLNLVQ